jgi:methionyl-tRNA formyltransferase
MKTKKRIVYAANREIGIHALEILIKHGIIPVILLVSNSDYYEGRMVSKYLKGVPMICGKDFRKPEVVKLIDDMSIDYIVSVHFPYIIPPEILSIPRVGTLNLHPAYLPYNRGWNTPTWAILDQTPYGATLHWVDEGIDSGDIALQKKLEILPEDTAHSLYQRVLALELEVFSEAIPLLLRDELPRIPQNEHGTSYRKADLSRIQKLELDESYTVREVINKLRALTTNNINEAAYFEADGIRYFVTVEIEKET